MKMNYIEGIENPFESFNHQFLLDEKSELSSSYEEDEALEKIFHCDDLREVWQELWEPNEDCEKKEFEEEFYRDNECEIINIQEEIRNMLHEELDED